MMKILGVIFGLLGVVFLFIPPLGIVLLIIGAGLFVRASRLQREAEEERRHQEMLTMMGMKHRE